MPDPIYVLTEDTQYFSVTYYDNNNPTLRSSLESQWKKFNRTDPASKKSLKIWCRPTNPTTQVTVDYLLPPQSPAGRYRVETYVPGIHATTRNAIFAIANNFRQVDSQTIHDNPIAVVDMYDLFDIWHPLGEFDFDPGKDATSGRIRQFDLSREDPATEISFGPMRWVPMTMLSPGGLRFSSPVGTKAERDASFPVGTLAFKKYPVWDGQWFDFNPFLSWYEKGYHTGADLNLPGANDADKGKPVYAVGDGVVTFAGRAASWGNIIVIEHPDGLVTLPDGRTQSQKVYSRYGHMDNRLLIRTGQPVQRGQNIGFIGSAAGSVSGWHLHFDISYSDMLKCNPTHWPNLATVNSLKARQADPASRAVHAAQIAIKKEVLNHYLDPLKFIRENHF
jgi:murein DD-endopeptidase MepM/ murein hydrolase activator NlpD